MKRGNPKTPRAGEMRRHRSRTSTQITRANRVCAFPKGKTINNKELHISVSDFFRFWELKKNVIAQVDIVANRMN